VKEIKFASLLFTISPSGSSEIKVKERNDENSIENGGMGRVADG